MSRVLRADLGRVLTTVDGLLQTKWLSNVHEIT